MMQPQLVDAVLPVFLAMLLGFLSLSWMRVTGTKINMLVANMILICGRDGLAAFNLMYLTSSPMQQLEALNMECFWYIMKYFVPSAFSILLIGCTSKCVKFVFFVFLLGMQMYMQEWNLPVFHNLLIEQQTKMLTELKTEYLTLVIAIVYLVFFVSPSRHGNVLHMNRFTITFHDFWSAGIIYGLACGMLWKVDHALVLLLETNYMPMIVVILLRIMTRFVLSALEFKNMYDLDEQKTPCVGESRVLIDKYSMGWPVRIFRAMFGTFAEWLISLVSSESTDLTEKVLQEITAEGIIPGTQTWKQNTDTCTKHRNPLTNDKMKTLLKGKIDNELPLKLIDEEIKSCNDDIYGTHVFEYKGNTYSPITPEICRTMQNQEPQMTRDTHAIGVNYIVRNHGDVWVVSINTRNLGIKIANSLPWIALLFSSNDQLPDVTLTPLFAGAVLPYILYVLNSIDRKIHRFLCQLVIFFIVYLGIAITMLEEVFNSEWRKKAEDEYFNAQESNDEPNVTDTTALDSVFSGLMSTEAAAAVTGVIGVCSLAAFWGPSALTLTP
tara:strand:- start:857 stop:2512 length:1656 start_codon:yes stop_codon:yes gene_type:complete